MPLSVVLSNDFEFYADGEIVNQDPPLVDGSIGAEFSELDVTIETQTSHRVATSGPGQVLGLRYRPPVTHVPSGIAQARFRYVPIAEEVDPDTRVEGAPILFVDVAQTHESTTFAGYGFAVLAASAGEGTQQMVFDNGGFSPAADIGISESLVFDWRAVFDPLDWVTAQIEWSDTTVDFSILNDVGTTIWSWSSTVDSTRSPLQNLQSGGFYDGNLATPMGPVETVIDSVYLAVATDDVTPPGPITVPVTRLWPRDDSLGEMGSATRLYPVPKHGRVIGGYN